MSTDSFSNNGRWAHQKDPQLFEALRRTSVSHLQGVLSRTLVKVDDWLFELAQKDGASSGSPHLDAMRSLRHSRAAIERAYNAHFEKGFDNLLRRLAPLQNARLELSLLDDAQLEAQLASEVLIDAVERAHGPALKAVDQRFAAMVGVRQLEAEVNPISSRNFAQAIQASQSDVVVAENVRVVFFKHFERELTESLGILLTELNERLVAAGILPELGNPKPAEPQYAATAAQAQAQKQRQAQAQAAAQRPQAYSDQAQADDRAMFDALCGLLRSWRPHHEPLSAPAAAGGVGPRSMAPSELVSVLSLLQPSVPRAVQEAMGRPEASLSMLLKQEMMTNAHQLGLPADQVRIGHEDEDAVDLVGMLFDVLFDERDFEAQARTLISRLVVPYVKAAVLDRRLFQYKTHPARRLLNSLAEAVEGNKGEGPQERELLGKAEETVDRLVSEFNEDIAIFETLEQELRAFLEQHRRRIELAERRATEAQRGQERLEQARTLAASELSKRVEAREVPDALGEFLGRAWTHHLSMIALREGPESASWNAALGVADGLVDLLPGEGKTVRSPAPVVNNLREPLEHVLASSGITGEAAYETLRGLVAAIESVQQQIKAGAASEAAPAAATAYGVESLVQENKPLLSLVSDKDRLDFDAEDLPAIRALKVGAWIDLAGEDGRLHPAKLSWVSPISARLMFVNRRGVRVLVASVEELAAMKKQGKLAVRAHDQVFDQALHRVMGRLQNDVA
ncbi:DUF1631 family protein [Arenimonas sp.]|uniref:DUF1631 family protein n=1 Tax=Arenimonas sp. TaxID=1872635 RepID=UPI0039E5EC7F